MPYFTIITNSMLTALLDCQRRFFFSYVSRLTPKKEPDYFKWGHLVHKCLEGIDLQENAGMMMCRVMKWLSTQNLEQKDLSAYMCMLPMLKGFYEGYVIRHGYENEKYETIAPEKRFELKLPSGSLFLGKIDRLAKHKKNGETFVWEIKTAAQAGADYWTRLEMDSQITGYTLAAQRCEGLKSTRVIYDLCRKPQKKQKVEEDFSDYAVRIGEDYVERREILFERKTFTLTQKTIDNHVNVLEDALEAMNWHFENAIWLPACMSPSRKSGCPFKPLCFGGAQDLFYTRTELNSELEEEVEVESES